MRFLHWNCRGFGRPATVRTLGDLLREYNPECIFLSETKVSLEKVEGTLRLFGFYNFSSISAVRKVGGVCLAWRHGVDLEVTLASKNCINGIVSSDPPSQPWMISFIYGPTY